MIELGLRVIRCFNRPWDDKGGSNFEVGTVSEIRTLGHKRSYDATVVVQWDCGQRSIYQGSYDLIILDNAQIGVHHEHVGCDSCEQVDMIGIRYKCTICRDYDLCFLCYHNNKHNLEHAFIRYDTPKSRPIRLSPRNKEERISVKGIFSRAIVTRGHDWKWYMYDGGEGSEGYVNDILNRSPKSFRSMARVTWHNGQEDDFRVGHKGLMELECKIATVGGQYYVKHLPYFSNYSSGERVKVVLGVQTLKILQENNRCVWNPRMEEYIGKVGIVNITDKGEFAVKYEGLTEPWKFHPDALERIVGNATRLSPGAEVRLYSDLPFGHRLEQPPLHSPITTPPPTAPLLPSYALDLESELAELKLGDGRAQVNRLPGSHYKVNQFPARHDNLNQHNEWEKDSASFDDSGMVKKRVELARAISLSLGESSNQRNKGLSLYLNQQKRSTKWVRENKEPSTMQQMQETQVCSICMEQQRTVAFQCGHQACTDCAAKLDTCHMCRKRITTKIKLY